MFAQPFRLPKTFLGIALGASIAAIATVGTSHPASAVPSFSRQTGAPCGACHTDYPALTPFGRRFKLGGYTMGGGQFRKTPFPTSEEDKKKDWMPPVAMEVVPGFTHTQASLAAPTAPYKSNDNIVVSPFSVFEYAGAITDHLGMYSQITYTAPSPGGLGPFDHTWAWDMTELRYANTTKVGNADVTYGIFANNNPTLQDVWNTAPAWRFPFMTSAIAPTPMAATIVDGAFMASVIGAGGYMFVDDKLYLEAAGYQSLDFNTQNSLGVNPFMTPGLLSGIAPYFRVAFEPQWGKHSLEIGASALLANVHPWVDATFAMGTTATFPQTDKFTDLGIDSQYQYQGGNYWLTLRGSYIHEDQKLDASVANGSAANPTNALNTLRADASFAYGNDNRIVLTGQYFNTWGTSDMGLYAMNPDSSPNSDGWVAEIAYIPFGSSFAPLWPWFNARLGLQYTIYNKFDGDSVHASDNNTLFAYAWFAM